MPVVSTAMDGSQPVFTGSNGQTSGEKSVRERRHVAVHDPHHLKL